MGRFLKYQPARYNPNPDSNSTQPVGSRQMNPKRREHFRKLLLADLRRHAAHIGEDQAQALDVNSDDAKESSDLASRDVIQELALKLGDHESRIVADIDMALRRMDEGSYGLCVRCGHEIDERRLEAMPTARYDAACQATVEQQKGTGAGPSL
jgi:DnaK suppressor protein